MANVADVIRALEILNPDVEKRRTERVDAEHDEIYLPGPSPDKMPEGTVEFKDGGHQLVEVSACLWRDEYDCWWMAC